MRKNLLVGLILLLFTLQSSRAFSQCSNYIIPNVPHPIKQPTAMACWATVYTMMCEWKQNQILAISDAMNDLGDPFKLIYEADAGLQSTDKINLVTKTHLIPEGPASYSIDSWCQMLHTYGPLWITTDELPSISQTAIHARLLYGINSDQNGTSMLFIDPATGTSISEDYNIFIDKYESELKKVYQLISGNEFPSDYEIRIQVIHW